MTDPDLGIVLLRLAREAIGESLGFRLPLPPPFPALAAPGATFVTLRCLGELRGCIGTVAAWRPLGEDVRANAVAAAFHDPRFMPLAQDEFADLAVEVSLLEPPRPLAAMDERHALAQLRPGVDGVVLECGARHATFLPQVWEQLPDPLEFLGALRRKAGLSARYWGDDLRLACYEVRKFSAEPALP